MFDSVGTLVIQVFQGFQAASNSSWRHALRMGKALALVVWQEMNESLTPSLSVWITTLHPANFPFHRHIAQNTAKNSHSKMIAFLFDALIFIKTSSVNSSEKKLTFSPTWFTRTAPIPAVVLSASGSRDASVKMNDVEVLFVLKLRGIFIWINPKYMVGDDRRASGIRPSPASYARCVTEAEQRLATRPKTWPEANGIRPRSLNASFLDIRPESVKAAIVSDNSAVRFSVLSIRVRPWRNLLTSIATPSAVTFGENGGAFGPSSANFQPNIRSTAFTVKSTDCDSDSVAREMKSSK